MDEEKKKILAEIEAKQAELNRLNIKEQTFVEMISHLRSRVNRVETRKREIHDEISDIRAKVRAWEQARK